MTTQHTPGPWNVTGLCVREQDGGLVASIIDLWHDQKTPKAEKNANAALIAAAPELLAALIDLMAMIDSPQISIYGVVDQQWTVAKRETRAAIARATGAAQ